MRHARIGTILSLAVALAALAAWSTAWGAGTYDWSAARRQAQDAASAGDAERAWGESAYIHLRLGSYYQEMIDLAARTQVDIVRRRASYEKTAAAAAAHAFVAAGQFDSAAAWAQHDPTLTVIQQIMRARMQNRDFRFDATAQTATNAELLDGLLVGLHLGAEDGQLRSLAQKLGNPAPQSQSLPALLQAVVAADNKLLLKALEEVEASLARPLGTEGSLLEQFGDPLIYSALARAHYLLAVDACEQALAIESDQYTSVIHLFRGLALYGMGRYDEAHEDLTVASNSGVAGIASAFLAGVASHRGNQSEARRWTEECLASERDSRNGEALVALARVQREVRARDWPTAAAAREIVRRRPDSRAVMYAAYWALALLSDDTPIDSTKQMYWRASHKRKPDIGHNFPDVYCSQQELFCTNYISALVTSGSQGNGLDYLDAYNGMMELGKSIPASEPVKEGLRWLSVVMNPLDTKEGGNVRN